MKISKLFTIRPISNAFPSHEYDVGEFKLVVDFKFIVTEKGVFISLLNHFW